MSIPKRSDDAPTATESPGSARRADAFSGQLGGDKEAEWPYTGTMVLVDKSYAIRCAD